MIWIIALLVILILTMCCWYFYPLILTDPTKYFNDTTNFKRPHHPAWYKDLPEDHPDVQNFYKGSEKAAKKTKRYTDLGYKQTRMPKEIFDYLTDISETTDRIPEGKNNIFPRSSSGPPPYLIPIPESKKVWIQNILLPIVEDWVGFPLTHAATYGPREYRYGSALRSHVDRDTHIISLILHIGRDGNPDKDWALEITGHDNIKKDIFMNPGDMVLYESRACHHSREKPNPYKYYRNIFFHFYPTEGGWESANIPEN